MNRSGQNFVIDAVMFILMMGLAGIGFLLEYVLVPGREVPVKYGINADLFLFGLERDQWADIHLVIAFVLLGLLVLHIVLHWKGIGVMYRNLISSPGWRKFLTPAFVAVSLVLCLFFLVVQPEFREFTRGTGRGRLSSAAIANEPAVAPIAQQNEAEEIKGYIVEPEPANIVSEPVETTEQSTASLQPATIEGERKQLELVRGMYSLGEVAEAYGVPASYIKDKLGLPKKVSSLDKLGKLRRIYGFTMSDIERIITDHNKDN